MKRKAICLLSALFMTANAVPTANVYANDATDIYLENTDKQEVVHADNENDMPDFNRASKTNFQARQMNTPINNTAIDLDDYYINELVRDKTLRIKSYDDNKYLKNVSTYRGDYQIREVIPFTVHAGETITLWQISGLNQVDLTVEAKTGLEANDVTEVLTSDGRSVQLRAKEDSVIYINMPRTSFNDITVEYSISGGTSLPIFTQGETDENIFFAEWDKLDSANAILQNDVIIMQIPKMNKEYLKNLKAYESFNNVNHLLNYYEEMIEYYDFYYGLDNSTYYNYNPRQRYLFIPELRHNGNVVGSYSKNIVKAYRETDGMEKALSDSWLGKHELAHGYQGDMMQNDISIDEIWNNIPAHYYSMNTKSNYNKYKIEYNGIHKPANQKSVYDKSVAIRNKSALPEYSLDFFREIFDTFGIEGFITFNQEYRRLGVNNEHKRTTPTNLFAQYFSEGTGVDLAPYFLSYGHKIDSKVIANNRNLPNVAFLNDIVKSEDRISYVLNAYDLVSKYSLVDTSIFSDDSYLRTLKGNVVVNIDIDDKSRLEGKQVILKNGEYEYKAEINGLKAEFNNVPVGVYKLGLPLTNSGTYNIKKDNYVVVAEGENVTASASYTKFEDFYLNFLYNFEIQTNNNYTPLTADLTYIDDNYYNLKIETLEGRENYGVASNDLYAYFKVYDDKNYLVASEEFLNNTPSVASIKNITLRDGYKIHMYRADRPEKKFYRNTVTYVEQNDDYAELMVFEVDENGLKYIHDNSDIDKNTVDTYIDEATKNYFADENQYAFTQERFRLNNTIRHLPANEQSKYFRDNIQNLRVNNPVLTVTDSKITTGLNNYNIDYFENVSATDFEDGNITHKVTVDTSNVDFSKTGNYPIVFRVEDSDYNFAKINATLTVTEDGSNSNNTGDNGSGNGSGEGGFGGGDNTGSGNGGFGGGDSGNGYTNNGDNSFSNDKVDFELENRNPYYVRKDDVPSNYNLVDNKNLVIPYYYDNNLEKNLVKLSTYKDGKIVYLDLAKGKYDYKYELNQKYFTDTANSWAKDSIDFVASREILTGISQTEFAPKLEVSRAMIVTVLGRLSNIDPSQYTNNPYVDVKNGVWYTPYVIWAKQYGIAEGVDSTHYYPNQNLTREQLAVIIDNYLGYVGYDIGNKYSYNYYDNDDISAWAKDSVYLLRSLDIMKGDSYNKFNPKSTLSRQELSAVLERIVNLIIEAEEEFVSN